MSKLTVLSLAALAALAGCASEHKVAPAPAPVVVQPAPTTPPTAVDSIIDLAPSAAAGSSVPNANKRVGIRMDDGTLQYLDTAANDLAVGDRVAITVDEPPVDLLQGRRSQPRKECHEPFDRCRHRRRLLLRAACARAGARPAEEGIDGPEGEGRGHRVQRAEEGRARCAQGKAQGQA